MKSLVIILIFLISLIGIPDNIYAKKYCHEIIPAPEIKLSTSYGQLQYDFEHNTKQISKMAAQIGHIERSFFASGLATLSIEAQYTIGTQAYPSKDNEYCVVPEVIQVYVGYVKPRIYISNELEKNSCIYNLVLLHEQTHQRINKTTLDYFLPIFKEYAFKIAQKIKPRKIKDTERIQKATESITQEFTNEFEKIVKIFKKELAIEQGKLDNSINYSMEDNLCRDFNRQKLYKNFERRQHREKR